MSETKQHLLNTILELCEELDELGAETFFRNHEPLDVVSRISHSGGRQDYIGAEIVIATGGPHIEVVTGGTNDRIVGYWGGDQIERSAESDTAWEWAVELFAEAVRAEH